MPTVRHRRANPFLIQPLEPRVLLAATPASVLTKQMRQTLLGNMSINIKSQLQTKLDSNDLAGFDQQLLTYMVNRTTGQFYFKPSDVPDYVTYIESNFTISTSRADDILDNLYPLQDEASDTLTLPEDIDWIYTGYSTNPETIHTLNRQAYWVDLAMAYRYTDNSAYADKIVSQLADWSSQSPALNNPNSWETSDAPWWRLNAAMRAENWAWTYSLLVGTPAWGKEANTLFLCKALEHGQFLYSVAPAALTSNQAFLHAKGLLCVSLLFPEFTASTSWELKAEEMVFSTMDAQFYDDGGHAEQSAGYASIVIRGLLQAKLLEQANGITWSAPRDQQITDAVDAVFQVMTPDGKDPAMGDSYRQTEQQLWFHANLVQNTTRWPLTRPGARDAWVFGPDAVDPHLGYSGNPPLGPRPDTYALPDAGNYVMRSGSDTDARQILFDAGPKGFTHGHADLFNFELFGYGKPLIADPGLYMYDTSAKRKWATSTPAHNTISIDDLNVASLEGQDNPGIIVDNWEVEVDHVQITAHHFGYASLAGRPIVSRTIWYDYDNTMLVIDWVEGVESHTSKTSFLIPGTSTSRDLANGEIHSTASGANVKIQTLLLPGQTANYKTSGIFTSSNPPPNQQNAATQFYVTQTGTFMAFATLITAYDGPTPPPDVSASWLTTPVKGQPLALTLVRGSDVEDISFTPPTLNYPTSKGGVRSSYGDIAYDSKGQIHYSFQDKDDLHLKYTVRSTNGKWSAVEIVDASPSVGYNSSIVIDSAGNVGVAYSDAKNGDLKYAAYRAGAWTVQTVDSRGTTGYYPSLAFTRKGSPVIAYYDRTKGDLRMAGATSTGWALATLDAGNGGTNDVGKYPQLSLDPSRPTATKWSIFYEDTSNKRYLYATMGKLGGGVVKGDYTQFTVASAAKLGGYTSLAFDSSNRPAVSWYDANITGLKYAVSSASTTSGGGIVFSSKTVTEKGTTGLHTNLFFDSSNRATIFYFDHTQNKAMRVLLSSGKWSATALGVGGRDLHTSRYNGKTAFTNVNQGLGLEEVWIV